MNLGLTVLKALASSCSVVMILSSAPSLYNIHKRHDTGDVSLFPLVGLWLNCVMVMLYGWTSGSYFPLFSTYVFGTIISTVYIGVYFRWTKARTYATKVIGIALMANVLGSVYVVLGMTGVTGQSTSQVELIAGNMMTVACLLPYVAPFETIKTVLKTRSGASIPFGMCLAGATSNLIWTIEGLFSNDMFILFLSAACSTLGFIQVALYLIFRPSTKLPIVDASVTDSKLVLPMKDAPTKLGIDVCRPTAVDLIPPRCGDKIAIVAPDTVEVLCL
ncbi:Sugar efflux transporter for intercellular exchange [Phytophthora infestans]|uniref:Sugar efflux transporter for intercellular exchange n=1 Tax=Phytophthora infestans TaxID=4787 RepID=A0A8S9THL8_PHYIN|nr:Sugar efflux transporter for intercellular exchange [Phytophthora infestans]